MTLHCPANQNPPGLKVRIVAMYAFLCAVNLGAWAWALIAFHNHPLLLGSALLAYSFGLRHAVDADHIAAIDNVTRKLMQDGKRPVAVGLYFSLGHSTIVILASTAVAAAAITLQSQFESYKTVGGMIGTLVSALFLLVIAGMNLLILANLLRTFSAVRAGAVCEEDQLNALLAGRGIMARIFRPIFRLIRHSWHMYPLGFLFGLGFDTATEVGLLGIAATTAGKGLHVWSIMVFPVLFTAGMSLVDTTDGVLMLGAYGWAFVEPLRKLYYNITITLVSVVVAVLIGGIEVLGLIGGTTGSQGPFWAAIEKLNDDYFGLIGFVIIGVFVAAWLAAAWLYRLAKPDQVGAPAA
jgi:high-affinity nickel-transport protein